MWCVLTIYTISISILCVSKEGLSPVESNQQMYDFFEQLKHCGPQVNFWIRKLFIQCNTGSCCAHITDGVSIYLCLCKYVGPCMPCVLCLCLCLWYQIRIVTKTITLCRKFEPPFHWQPFLLWPPPPHPHPPLPIFTRESWSLASMIFQKSNLPINKGGSDYCHIIRVKPAVNSMLCCIKHTSRCC